MIQAEAGQEVLIGLPAWLSQATSGDGDGREGNAVSEGAMQQRNL
jgi:hypothetical protein